ncbi:MAG TPA: carbohydrate-binding family 9-like protein [Candidatus Saccharimonadales bacterium]|nr:carbohydrate-binding family 9-like protein [Candidatus Saccharimonadales bacterium]
MLGNQCMWKMAKRRGKILLGIVALGCGLAMATMVAARNAEAEKSLMASHRNSADAQEAKYVVWATKIEAPKSADGLPGDEDWTKAEAIRFATDWQGKNADPQRETEVRVLWTPETLFLKYHVKYKTITVFADSEPNGRRDKLWDRDVVEAFLQPDPSVVHSYKELEFSPNNMWIDLDIAERQGRDLKSGLTRRVTMDEGNKTWTAVAALPMKSLVSKFDATAVWRANFYRIEGAAEPRFYSAWSATKTEKPNFHVPEAFGFLRFR